MYWAAQGAADSEKICAVYASFVPDKGIYIGSLLQEVALIDDGGEVTFGVCAEMQGGRPVPNIVLLH